MTQLEKIFDKVVADKIRAIPEKARIIETAKTKGRLLAVRGNMDYVEKVLPHCYAADKVLIDAHEMPPDLQTFDAVFVGCPGKLRVKEWEAPLLTWLEKGGVLLTTDWCLTNLIQQIFPGTIQHRGNKSGTFPLRVQQPKHPLLEGLAGCTGTPWVVEIWSHCIEILDPKRVQVLLDAPNMGKRPAVLVAFDVGKGLVVHAISHFHLQGSEETGEYVSAYLLTNVIDEAIRRRYPAMSAPRIRLLESPEPVRPMRIRLLDKEN